jgi:hypothetical protein
MNNSVNKKGDCKLGKQIKILKQVSYKLFSQDSISFKNSSTHVEITEN